MHLWVKNIVLDVKLAGWEKPRILRADCSSGGSFNTSGRVIVVYSKIHFYYSLAF